jgi:hydroxymethylpyrimidine pyrophosphatase-like HAD family hydrolase
MESKSDGHGMTSRQVRLVLADVDGTLVTGDKLLTDATIAAVASLRRAGIELAVTSGRPPAECRCSSRLSS